MNNNNFESLRAFLISGLLICSGAVPQVQADEVNPFTSSTPQVNLQQSLSASENLVRKDAAAEDAAKFALLVENLETDFGPFDASLREPLLSVGDMLAEQGDYVGAVSYIERALHVMRVNQGLYSEDQIAVVERLIDCNVAVENWAAVDENFRYLEFLYTRLFEQGSIQWDRGIGQVADWHVIAINNNLGDDLENHLREANKLLKLRLSYAAKDENADPQLVEVLRHNVAYTAIHLRKQDEEIKTIRVYSRMGSRYHDDHADRADSVASLD